MDNQHDRGARHRLLPVSALALAIAATAGPAAACDGKPYTFDITVGQVVVGGGVAIQLDKIKLLDKSPDKYTISVKDDGNILADHMILVQFDSVSFKTRCGSLTIAANRKSMFQHDTLTVNWSYF